MPEATQAGLSENAAGALAYVTIIPAIVFLVMDPYNKSPYVKFHSWQCIFLAIACFAIEIVLGIIPFLGWIIIPFFLLAVLALVIFVAVKAYGGQKIMLPVIGGLAEKQANS